MGFPSSTNITGSNPGPNDSGYPDTTQSPVGNVQMDGVFSLELTPAAVAANTTAEQAFANTGVGLKTGDFVSLAAMVATAGVGIVGARVSAEDTLAVTFVNATSGSITPPASGSYMLKVSRPQPNWIKPASGNQMDF